LASIFYFSFNFCFETFSFIRALWELAARYVLSYGFIESLQRYGIHLPLTGLVLHKYYENCRFAHHYYGGGASDNTQVECCLCVHFCFIRRQPCNRLMPDRDK